MWCFINYAITSRSFTNNRKSKVVHFNQVLWVVIFKSLMLFFKNVKKWYINQVFINWEWGWECWNQNYSNVYLKIWRRDSELKWWALLRFGNCRWLGITTLILGPIKLSYSIFYIAKLPFIKIIYIYIYKLQIHDSHPHESSTSNWTQRSNWAELVVGG